MEGRVFVSGKGNSRRDRWNSGGGSGKPRARARM